MNSKLLVISLLAAVPAFAATTTTSGNFGGASSTPPSTNTAKPPTALAPVYSGPQVTGLFRIVKPDGSTLIQQTAITTGGSSVNVINVSDKDAFIASKGKCAFNVKYDEVSAAAALNTTNRLYDNDALIAQNTKIDLAAGVLKTIWTQPYLTAGQNTVRVVVNADSAMPSTGYVRINVAGTCGASTAPPSPPVVTAPQPKPPVTTPPPPPPAVKFLPGSTEWNNLYTAFGYSNYGVTQLKSRNYARYSELVKLNADITAVVNAKVVEQPTYNALMTRWNSFVNDAGFRTAMQATATTTAAVSTTAKK